MSTNDMLVTPEEINSIEIEAEPADANPAGLVPLVNVPPTPSAMSMSDIMNLGHVLVRSGMFRSTTSAEQAVAKILAGREYGLGPIQSMTHIYVIDGKVGMSAALIGAKIRQHSAYDFQVTNHDDTQCSITFYYRGKEAGTSEFTIQHAKDAGLIRKGGAWEKYPRNMVYARALTNGARWYCPDVFGGAIYTPDELGAGVVFDSTNQEVYEPKISAPPALKPTVAQVPQAGATMLEQDGPPVTGGRGGVTIAFKPVVLTVQDSSRGENKGGSFQNYRFNEAIQYVGGNGNLETGDGIWSASFQAYTDNIETHEGFENRTCTRGEFTLAVRQSPRGDRWWPNVVAVMPLPDAESDWPEMPQETEE